MTMPALPQVGALNWGPDVNACLVWLYEQMDANAQAIEGLVREVDALQSALSNQPEYVYNSYAWQYSNQGPPPTGSQVRFDNADLTLATVATFRLIDSDSADRTPVFQRLDVGSKMRINDWDDSSITHSFDVTGPAILGASDASVPIAWTSGSGTIPNAKANVAFLLIWT